MKNLQRLLITGTLLAGVLITASSASGAQKMWNGLAGDTLWSTGGNWSPAGAPGTADNVTFTNVDFAASPIALGGSINNVVDAGFVSSINSLGYMNTNGFHNTQVINNLSVIGTSASDVASIADDGEPSVFFVGSNQWQDGKDDSVYATIIGNSLRLSNGNANLGVTQISATAGAHRATLDLTGLNSFTCVVSNVLVGHNFTQPDHAWRPTGTLLLAKTNSITTRIIIVSDAYHNGGATSPGSSIQLGQLNTLNADEIRIGMHKCVGFIAFEPGLVNPSVKILNITDGSITNFATLSVTNINLLGSVLTFTVYPGQAIAPAGVGVVGPLSVAGDFTLRGGTVMDISKINTTLSADQLAVSGTLDLGGTLTVTFSGNTNLVVGDKFTLFSSPAFANSFTTVNLPPPGSGLGWTNKILIDGSIEAIATGEPLTPPTIAASYSPTSVSLAWPPAYTSFALRGQTNPITVGLSTNWGLVPGVVGNQVTIPVDPANGSVFFQLFQQ